MEKLSFCEVLALAESVDLNFDYLLNESSDGGFIDRRGEVFKVVDSDRFLLSDNAYDKISAYIKVLEEVLSFRPLPF